MVMTVRISTYDGDGMPLSSSAFEGYYDREDDDADIVLPSLQEKPAKQGRKPKAKRKETTPPPAFEKIVIGKKVSS